MLHGKQFVVASDFNTKAVNRSAPDLFPAACLVKELFIRRETGSLAPFDLIGIR